MRFIDDDFSDKEKNDYLVAMRELDNALARITCDLKHAQEMLRRIKIALTDVIEKGDKTK